MPQHEQLRNTLPHQPHDKYARYVLQISRIAADLIRLTLPPGLLEEIDLDTLASGKESYVDSQMAEHLIDVCYTCRLKSGRPLRVSILFEHKSDVPDTPVYFQLLRYIVHINSAELKQNQPPSVVIPILLYHGARPFKKEAPEDIFSEYSAGFHEMIPRYEYYVADVSNLSSLEHFILAEMMTQHFFEVLRAGRNPYIIPEVFKEICSFVLNNTLPDVELSFYRVSTLYFTKISPDFITKFFADMENENETVVEQYINAVFTPENLPTMLKRIENIEVFRKQGIEEGKAQGIAQGKAQGIAQGKAEGIELTIGTFLLKVPDMPDDEVANLFDVTPGYIRKLREKLKKG